MENKAFKIAVIGGKLQGTESVYLAKKAGFYSILIDKRERVAASGLCDEFICADITKPDSYLIKVLKNADLVLPAMENDLTLDAIHKLTEKYNLNTAFDFNAYRISSSKFSSDQLFHNNNIPVPAYFPDCKSPYIVKPSVSSGSEGVKRIQTKQEVEEFLKNVPAGEVWIAEEYLTGPSYSIEVIGKPGAYKTYQITEIHMDEVYDCNQVTCPCPNTAEQKRGFAAIAVKLAELVSLNGIMDVEVIDDEGVFKVLEIDARIPSQTPTAVYHSTGVNFVSELARLFGGKWDYADIVNDKLTERYASYEHYYAENGRIKCLGEHIMSGAGPLGLYSNYLSSDEVITDYKEGDTLFRGTFINSGKTLEELEQKRLNMLEALRHKFIK